MLSKEQAQALLATRDKLASVIGSTNPRTQHVYIDGNDACLAIADALLASGVVRDSATLAVLVEQAAIEQLECFDTVMNVSAEARGVVDRFLALAAALTEDPSC